MQGDRKSYTRVQDLNLKSQGESLQPRLAQEAIATADIEKGGLQYLTWSFGLWRLLFAPFSHSSTCTTSLDSHLSADRRDGSQRNAGLSCSFLDLLLLPLAACHSFFFFFLDWPSTRNQNNVSTLTENRHFPSKLEAIIVGDRFVVFS